jgi:hypothetical protein
MTSHTGGNMIDGFRDYDAWKLDSPFDDYDYDNHDPSE